jgi:hypothetical protein
LLLKKGIVMFFEGDEFSSISTHKFITDLNLLRPGPVWVIVPSAPVVRILQCTFDVRLPQTLFLKAQYGEYIAVNLANCVIAALTQTKENKLVQSYKLTFGKQRIPMFLTTTFPV